MPIRGAAPVVGFTKAQPVSQGQVLSTYGTNMTLKGFQTIYEPPDLSTSWYVCAKKRFRKEKLSMVFEIPISFAFMDLLQNMWLVLPGFQTPTNPQSLIPHVKLCA